MTRSKYVTIKDWQGAETFGKLNHFIVAEVVPLMQASVTGF